MKVNETIDFHGYTRDGMLAQLEQVWSSRRWHGLNRVAVIHGKGQVLHIALRVWCDDKGIRWAPDPANAGVTVLHPSNRVVPTAVIRHLPLKGLKHKVVLNPSISEVTKPAAATEEPGVELSPAELMAAEFEKLAAEESRAIIRRKHSPDHS